MDLSGGREEVTICAWPVARSIFDAPYVREANERVTGWIREEGRRGCGLDGKKGEAADGNKQDE